MKKCIKCSIEKGIIDFPKSGNICKSCKSIYIKEYYLANKEKVKISVRKYFEENKDNLLEKQKVRKEGIKKELSSYLKEYRKLNKSELDSKRKKYNEDNKERINETRKKRYKVRIKTDLEFKLKKIHRNLLKRVLKYKKHERTSELLGYTSIELRENIESKFKAGMSWDNYGEWEIDHIKPVSSFDLENTDPSIVSSLDNLQPLWELENIKKSNNYVQE